MAFLGAYRRTRLPIEIRHRLVLGGLFLSLTGTVVFAVQLVESRRAKRKSAKIPVEYCEAHR